MSFVPEGVIFDMDGTLLDSERLARACFLRAWQDLDLGEVDIEIYNRCIGCTGEESRRIMEAGFGPDFDYVAMEARWSYHYHACLDRQPVPVLPGVEDLLQHLRALGIPMAVATSSRRPTVEKKLAGAGIAGYFSYLVCGGEAARGKPFPHPYLRAAQQLALPAQRCWAVEDSENGVRSARAAGMVVFQIPNEIAPNQALVNLGHHILPSATDLLQRLKSLRR